MSYKWIGAVLIIGSCTGFGFSISLHRLRETMLLAALDGILETMICELSYRLTPLPILIKQVAIPAPTALRKVLSLLADKLDAQVLPDAACCMESAIHDAELSYDRLNLLLKSLGQSLGRFDLEGQIKDLSFVQSCCRNELHSMKENQSVQNRSYRILGICAGISLAILLI